MAHDVFISYSTSDKSVADAICSYLESNRIRCWIAPRDITPGKKYALDIMDAINDCKVMVVVFSASANNSGHVSAEIERAMSRGIIIIPFRIENVLPTGEMEYYLSGRHWLDALTVPMEQHIQRLVGSVQTVLGNQAGSQPEGPAVVKKINKQVKMKKKLPAKGIAMVALTLFMALIAAYLVINTLSRDKSGASTDNIKDAGATSRTTVAASASSDAKTDAKSDDKPDVHRTEKINADIIDVTLIDGWVHVQLKNKGEKGDFKVILKGYDRDGKTASIDYLEYFAVETDSISKSSIYVGEKITDTEAYVLDDYGKDINIKEYALIDNWANVILVNGGETGNFNVVIKGYDSDNRVTNLEFINFNKILNNSAGKNMAYVGEIAARIEPYIVRDYGNGPAVLEYALMDGWVNAIVANGGETSNINVSVKAYDKDGKVVASDFIAFSNIEKNCLGKSGIYVGNEAVKAEVSLIE